MKSGIKSSEKNKVYSLHFHENLQNKLKMGETLVEEKLGPIGKNNF
jgi:hypothetical protein